MTACQMLNAVEIRTAVQTASLKLMYVASQLTTCTLNESCRHFVYDSVLFLI